MASTHSAISTIPTLTDADFQLSCAVELRLSTIESSLKTTRDSLEKALEACININNVLMEMANNPLYKNSMARSLKENGIEYAELSIYVVHLRMNAQVLNQGHEKSEFNMLPSHHLVATGEEVRSRVRQVMAAQRCKCRRVARMEKLYRKEKDLAAGILMLRDVLQRREDDRKAHEASLAPKPRPILVATGAKRSKA